MYEGPKMNVLDQKNEQELAQSIVAELAKASNELRCAQADLQKVTSRLSFVLAVANTLVNRQGD